MVKGNIRILGSQNSDIQTVVGCKNAGVRARGLNLNLQSRLGQVYENILSVGRFSFFVTRAIPEYKGQAFYCIGRSKSIKGMYVYAFFVNIIAFRRHFPRRIVGAPNALYVAPIGKTGAFIGNNARVHVHFGWRYVEQAFAPF